jgi:hypothetical protein
MRYRTHTAPWRPVTVRNACISIANQGRYPLRAGDPWARAQIRDARERQRRPVSPKPLTDNAMQSGESGLTTPGNG